MATVGQLLVTRWSRGGLQWHTQAEAPEVFLCVPFNEFGFYWEGQLPLWH